MRLQYIFFTAAIIFSVGLQGQSSDSKYQYFRSIKTSSSETIDTTDYINDEAKWKEGKIKQLKAKEESIKGEIRAKEDLIESISRKEGELKKLKSKENTALYNLREKRNDFDYAISQQEIELYGLEMERARLEDRRSKEQNIEDLKLEKAKTEKDIIAKEKEIEGIGEQARKLHNDKLLNYIHIADLKKQLDEVRFSQREIIVKY
ncbi:MAG: hypothetical protein H7A23_03595 [Leptospiraceae bacterium]|nr:hypothetical protein [Leptospiraceae bacterium]MCP5493614.1 hypothetical protein [Leptospiraceae bacterium]